MDIRRAAAMAKAWDAETEKFEEAEKARLGDPLVEVVTQDATGGRSRVLQVKMSRAEIQDKSPGFAALVEGVPCRVWPNVFGMSLVLELQDGPKERALMENVRRLAPDLTSVASPDGKQWFCEAWDRDVRIVASARDGLDSKAQPVPATLRTSFPAAIRYIEESSEIAGQTPPTAGRRVATEGEDSTPVGDTPM